MKAKKLVLNYLNKVNTFTWVTDTVENSIWGYKNSPYKSFSRAYNFVQKIMDKLESDGVVIKEEFENRKPIYHVTKDIATVTLTSLE